MDVLFNQFDVLLLFAGFFFYAITFGAVYAHIGVGYFKRKGKVSKGKVKAIYHSSKTDERRGRTKLYTNVIVEYLFNGEKFLFKGNNNNAFNKRVGDPVEIYLFKSSKDSRGHIPKLVRSNLYYFRQKILFIYAIPSVFVYISKSSFEAKVIFTALPGIIIIPFLFWGIREVKKGSNKSLYDIIGRNALKGRNGVSYKELEENNKYLKTRDEAEKVTTAGWIVGIIIYTIIFGLFGAFIFGSLNKMKSSEKQILINAYNDIGAVGDLFSHLNGASLYYYWFLGSVILSVSFILYLVNYWLKRRHG